MFKTSCVDSIPQLQITRAFYCPIITTMNKVTVVKLRNYTIISNDVLRDKRLSLKAKGMLITVLGLPDNWDFSIQGISTILKEGRDSVTAAISELIEFGYCSRAEERDSDGTFLGTDYTFHEAPIIARVEPHTGNPFTDNPYTENPTQLSKEEVSKQRIKNTSEISPKRRKTKDLTTIPEDFEITPPMREWFSSHCPLINIEIETAKFKERCLAKGTEYKDWVAGWRTQMMNAQGWAQERAPVPVAAPNRPTARQMHAKIDAEEALLREQHDSTQR